MGDTLLHVAVAVIRRGNEILISQRARHVDQGGLWEFPGGKVEAGETVPQALRRELEEELGITATDIAPLIQIPHQYKSYAVLLDVWQVDAFTGEPHGREGQPLQWVAPEALGKFEFPAANRPIIQACQLPDRCLITPEPENMRAYLAGLERALQNGIQLVQLRAKSLAESDYIALAREVLAMVQAFGARILLNGHWHLLQAVPEAHGIHLASHLLRELESRPIGTQYLLSTACHSSDELQQAARVGADFALLSPVLPTTTHPGAESLGWQGLHELLRMTALPVYALGGMEAADIAKARAHGAQGIAAIRGLWEE